jgi:hypothetical protein
LPIIDLVPILTQPAPYSTAAQTKGYDPLDVGGTIQIPITRAFSFSFDRTVGGMLDQANARVIQSNGTTYPAGYRDVVLTERLDYQYKQFVFEGGLSFRHRLANTGGVGVSTGRFPYTISSTEWHYAYLGVTYTTPPVRALGGSRFILGVTGEEIPVDQHVAVLNPTTHLVNYINENPNQSRYFESTEQAGIIIPVDAKHGFTVSARDIIGGANFYENAPFPYREDAFVILSATKKFNDFFSLTMRAQNQNFAKQGYPYQVPNVAHTESIDLSADFHVDTNRLVHGR